MSVNNVTDAESIFWTSNIIPLLMVALFAIQHTIVPDIHQEKSISFDANPKLNHASPSEAQSHGTEDSLLNQPQETDNTHPKSLYSDEHICLTSTSKFASELEWRLSYHSHSLTTTDPDNGFVIPRFLVAAAIQGLQLSLLNNTSLAIVQLAKQHKIGVALAFSLLLVPTAVCYLSMSYFRSEVDRAVEAARIETCSYALVVMTIMNCWLFLMFLCLAIPWVRVILASRIKTTTIGGC